MPASIFTVESPRELKLAVSERIAGIGAAENVILIVEDYAQIDEWRAFLADNGRTTNFGIKLTTLNDFAQDAWDLFGNSGNIVTPLLRKLALSVPLTLYTDFFGTECPIPDSIGTINLLSGMVEKGAGLVAFERGIDMFGTFGSLGEQAVWRILGEYMAFLDEVHFVEMGDILRRLIPFLDAYPNIIVAGLQDLTPMQIEFFEKANAQLFLIRGKNAPAYALVDTLISRFSMGSNAEALEPIGAEFPPKARSLEIAELSEHIYNVGEPIEARGDVRFAFSTSRYSEAMVVAQLVEEHVKAGYQPDDIVVTVKDQKIIGPCMRRLSDAGIASCARYESMFAKTSFGRAFIAIVKHDSKFDLSDFVLSPFSGLSLEQAYELDCRWRKNRMLTVEQCLDEYGEKSSRAKAIVDSLRADDLYRLSDLMVSAMYASSQPDDFEALLATRCSEMAANACDACITAEADILSMIKVLVHSKVPIARTLMPAGYNGDALLPAVRFMQIEDLARSQAKVAIMAQLTAEDFPVTKDDDVSVALFAKVGADISRDYLAETRNAFQRALSATSEKIVFERALYNDDGEEQRSSVLLEEVIDCYRADLTDFDSIDTRTGLPEELLHSELQLARFADDGNLQAISIRPQGASSARCDNRPYALVPYHRIEDLGPSELLDIGEALTKREDGSPRAISVTSLESYLACPRRWFIERQMRIESIDAELDNPVLGSFAHELLQRFYEALRDAQGRPMRADGLTRARSDALIDAIADECLKSALNSENPNPPVATGEVEKLEIDACIRQVKRLVWDDRTFIKRFVPTHFELTFGREGEFEYAGHPMIGIVDRIDVDDSGHAIVIDYKGTLGSEYYPSSKATGDLAIAPKVQPLVYASAVKRLLGFDVVGSIFRSYKKPKRVAGVYVGSHVKPDELFGYFKGTLTPDEFAKLLESTEERAAEAISRMSQGDIIPNPISRYACEYCPVAGTCPKAMWSA